MTLQRRLIVLLLIGAPLVWAVGLGLSLLLVRDEINELFDTQQILLAQRIGSISPAGAPASAPGRTQPAPGTANGEADLNEQAAAVWNRQGELLSVQGQGMLLPFGATADGFADLTLGGALWRVYYLSSDPLDQRVAVGQLLVERDELVWDLLSVQSLPWLLTLPLLLIVMTAAVRHALRPVRDLVAGIERRDATDLSPFEHAGLPSDLRPLVRAMNTLLERIDRNNELERRFIADAAHELRTPLAALQAQWDAARSARPGSAAAPAHGGDKITEGLERMGRLVLQLLSMSRLDRLEARCHRERIDWRALVQEVFSEVLPLADQRRVELGCDWPPAGEQPLALLGDPALVSAMLRNLLDNAVRHTPPGAQVSLRLSSDAVEVIDEGGGVQDEHLARLGDRFFRPSGAAHPGSGLGLSIVRRIAALHGLQVAWHNLHYGESGVPAGFVVRLWPVGAPGPTRA